MSHPDRAKPLTTLECTCCGREFQGRQWWNQDTGYGLGSCCLDYVQPLCTKEDFRETYGHLGIHIGELKWA